MLRVRSSTLDKSGSWGHNDYELDAQLSINNGVEIIGIEIMRVSHDLWSPPCLVPYVLFFGGKARLSGDRGGEDQVKGCIGSIVFEGHTSKVMRLRLVGATLKNQKKIPIDYKEPKDNEKHYRRSKFQLTLFAKYEVDVISSFESKNQLLRAVDSRLSELKEKLADALNKAIDTSCSPKDISKLEEDIRQMKRLKTWLNFRENVKQLTVFRCI
ncbi:hypothetical protein Tco_0713330 [Tanacetum coccineum]